MNKYINDTEKLKKEVWHLKSVALPNLEKIIDGVQGGAEFSELTNKVETLESETTKMNSKINTNFQAITQLDTSLGDLTAVVSEHEDRLTNHDERLTTAENNISTIATSLSDTVATVDGVVSSQSNLHTSVTDIKSTISSHSKKIRDLEIDFGTHDAVIPALIETAGNNKELLEVIEPQVNDHETRITALEQNQSSLSESVSANSQSIATMQSDIDAIKSSLGL